MKIEISVFATVVILFVLHTVLTHLFNWMWRSFKKYDADKIVYILIFLELCLVLQSVNLLLR